MTSLGRTGRNLVVALIAIGAIAPVPAAAEPCPGTAPPDNAQVDEYAETIPGACGNEPTSPQQGDDQGGAGAGGAAGGGSGPDAPVPAATVEQLESLGGDGAAAAALAQSTAPPSAGEGDPKAQGAPGGPRTDSPATGGGDGDGSILSGIKNAVSSDSSGGVGILLPLLLGAVLLGGIVYLLRRRSGATTHA